MYKSWLYSILQISTLDFSNSIIYLDEMDMIPKDVLDKVVNPILATTPDTMLIATSTPIGKKSKFWLKFTPKFKWVIPTGKLFIDWLKWNPK